MASLTNSPPSDPKAARHREIALRYAREGKRRGRKPINLATLRAAEIGRFFTHKYGKDRLPDDDAGREDLAILLHHVARTARSTEAHLLDVAAFWAARTPLEARTAIVKSVLAFPKRWQADPLGMELGLTDEVRTKLRIRTIGAVDVTKAQRAKRQLSKKRERDREYQRKNRLKKGPPHIALSVTKPWEGERVSRSTYYRRRQRETKKSSNKDQVDGDLP